MAVPIPNAINTAMAILKATLHPPQANRDLDRRVWLPFDIPCRVCSRPLKRLIFVALFWQVCGRARLIDVFVSHHVHYLHLRLRRVLKVGHTLRASSCRACQALVRTTSADAPSTGNSTTAAGMGPVPDSRWPAAS